MVAFFAFLIKLGLGGFINRTIGYLEKKAELEGERDRLKTDIAIEYMKQAVAEKQPQGLIDCQKLC